MPDLPALFDDLVRVQILLWDALDERLRRDFGLPLSRFEPLQVIGRTEPCRVQDIASSILVTVGGTSKLVDRLEASGYCERTSNPEDRRSSLNKLTADGRRLLAGAAEALEDELQARLAGVPQTVVSSLGEQLARTRAGIWSSRAPERAAG